MLTRLQHRLNEEREAEMARFLLRLERRKAKVLKRFIKSKADWLDSLTFDEWLDSPSDVFMSVLADQQRKELRCAGKGALVG